MGAPAVAALVDLRRARRRQRLGQVDWIDALYHAYLTGLGVVAAVAVLSGLVSDGRVAAATVARVAERGPAAVGAVAALAVAVGLRSGARGGPLALEAAEVRFVLLAPVARSRALRGPALRQLRFGAFVGAAVGAVGGELAVRRLPGHMAIWLACGAVAGALTAVAALGAGLVASGRRLPPPVASALAVTLLGWSAVDLLAHAATSPLTLLGGLGCWPLRPDPWALIGAACAVALPVAGLWCLGGVSIEAAERRASLVGQLRFAVTLQDLRTVLVLRRQLAQEHPRQRPWVALGPVAGSMLGQRFPVWRRDWRGVLRWPAVRVGRLLLAGVVAGLAARAAWSGLTPLVVVAGLAVYVAALEAIEPLAQEADHPDRTASLPLPAGLVHARHLPAAVAVLLAPGLAGVVAAAAVGPDRGLAVAVGLAVLLPAALLAACGAAASSLVGDTGPRLGASLFPEAMGVALVARTAWPPALAVAGVLPILAARAATAAGRPPVPAAVAADVGLLALAGLAVAWVRYRGEARAWWNQVLEGVPGQGGQQAGAQGGSGGSVAGGRSG